MTQDNAATADAVARKGLHKEERPKLDYQAFAPMVTLMLWRYRQEVLTFFSISSLLLPSVSIVTTSWNQTSLTFFEPPCAIYTPAARFCNCINFAPRHTRLLRCRDDCFFLHQTILFSTHCRSKILSTKAPRDCTSFSSLCYLLPLCCNNNDSTLHTCLFTASGI